MNRNFVIGLFNYYGINPGSPNNKNTINAKDLRRIKARLATIENKKPNIKLKGELRMKKQKITRTIMGEDMKPLGFRLLDIERNIYKEKIDKIDVEIKKLESIEELDRDQKKVLKECKDELTSLKKEFEKLTPFIVSVDTGKYNTKFCYEIEDEDEEDGSTLVTKLFPSKVQRISDCAHDSGKKFYVDGMEYALSSAKRVSDDDIVSSPEIDKMGNTKAHEYHRILMLKALYDISRETGRRVFNVAIGASLDSYREDRGAKVYLNMLDEKLGEKESKQLEEAKTLDEKHTIHRKYMENLRERYISKSFTVKESCGEEITLIINDLYVVPETITGATRVQNADALEFAVICDIGGLNESYLPVFGFAPDFEKVIVTKGGMSIKYKEIAYSLPTESTEIKYFSRNNVEYMLNHPDKIKPDTNELIQAALFEMFNQMVSTLTLKCAFDPDMTSLVFIGGGAKVLAPYLKTYFSTVVDIEDRLHIAEEDAIYANVAGMFDHAYMYFDGRNNGEPLVVA